MKILTFLGATTAYEITYCMPDGQEYTAPFCGVALARFFPDTHMCVFVTEAAKERHWKHFSALVENNVHELETVAIADGHNEIELWAIFQQVVDVVEKNEEVIFDITHGFRSLPILSFLAAAYLRVVKEIDLKTVLYGNFEARDETIIPNRAPVIDLTPFVSLLDWMMAANRFVRFGDAQDLADQLRLVRPDWKTQQQDAQAREQAQLLSLAAKAMDDVSLALRLIRPAEALVAADHLCTYLPNTTIDVQQQAQPFASLIHPIVDAYKPLALVNENAETDLQAVLGKEREMVQWYLDRKQYVQGLALAREWIVSWVMHQTDMADQYHRLGRSEVERILGLAIRQQRTRSGAFDNMRFSTGVFLKDITEIDDVIPLYQRLGDARNDLLHAGKRKSRRSASSMEKEINTLGALLNNIRLSSSE